MARGILTRQQILGTFCQESGCQVLNKPEVRRMPGLPRFRGVRACEKPEERARKGTYHGMSIPFCAGQADALEIRLRAERRLGQLIDLQRETVGLAKPPGHKARRRAGDH
jgi:hypothetical protein